MENFEPTENIAPPEDSNANFGPVCSSSEEFYERHRHNVRAGIYRKTRDASTLDDLENDLWVRLFSNRQKGRSMGSNADEERMYVNAAATYMGMDARGKKIRRYNLAPSDSLEEKQEGAPFDVTSSDDLEETSRVKFIVEDVMSHLPQIVQQIISLRYQGLKEREIGALLKLETRDVSKWLVYAKSVFHAEFSS